PVSNAKIMADTALAIGLDRSDLVLEEDSMDTKDEARLVKLIVGKDRFILVTTASHMPRSMALFRKQGMDPIPAPTEHLVKERKNVSPGMFFPGASNLRKVERAFNEYLGLVWGKMRDKYKGRRNGERGRRRGS
ncbi:MAG: YdcF family protein, partial [Deltaproteobacteria bacterium]|nr:YdcF family protein [Deltaproteobacteria bacterium]